MKETWADLGEQKRQIVSHMLRQRILDLCPKFAKSGRTRPKIINPYKDSLDDICDEPGFASALREVQGLEGVNLSDGTATTDGDGAAPAVWNDLVCIKNLSKGQGLINYIQDDDLHSDLTQDGIVVTVAKEDGQKPAFNIPSTSTLQDMRRMAQCDDEEHLWNDYPDVILDDEDKYRKYMAHWLQEGGRANLTVQRIGHKASE